MNLFTRLWSECIPSKVKLKGKLLYTELIKTTHKKDSPHEMAFIHCLHCKRFVYHLKIVEGKSFGTNEAGIRLLEIGSILTV